MQMSCIDEAKFAEICDGIRNDKETIIKHNPLGTNDEILLWMLVNCLVAYLSLTEMETPCFTGKPDARTYREAIKFILNGRQHNVFDPETYLDRMLAE